MRAVSTPQLARDVLQAHRVRRTSLGVRLVVVDVIAYAVCFAALLLIPGVAVRTSC